MSDLGLNHSCARYLREQGKSAPRTCRACGLGPCRNLEVEPPPGGQQTTLEGLVAFIRAQAWQKYHGGPVASPTDRALYRAAGIAFPQLAPGWPADDGSE